jgi:ABC-2 type transport system ATP-binding protein
MWKQVCNAGGTFPYNGAMLTLIDVKKAFGATVAVDGLSLQVKKGEVFGFLGPNGAGKTTTISMAMGLLAPDVGKVELEGFGSPMVPQNRRYLGIAPQALALYDELTAEENLKFFGRIYGLEAAVLRTRVDAALEMVSLTDRRKDRVKVYSGGMKRRLNLAAALLHEPKLVLLDEPTAGVDPQSRNNILEFVRALKEKGTTVIYTTHYMDEAQRLCDRVAVIDHGKLLAMGTVEELIAKYGGDSLVRGTRKSGEELRVQTTNPLAEIQKLLAAGDMQEVRIERPDLEAVFLTLTGRSLRDKA